MLESRLAEIVGAANVIADPGRLLAYESDGLTAYRSRPRAVVLPATAGEVRDTVALLHAESIPVVPRGAGTGLSGGALAGRDAVIVGTARMNRILELDVPNRIARVQPGVVNAELTQLALPHGLCYAPDPSSQSACTIGGNVAENSGGPHCLKYGVTSRYILGLEVVLAGGVTARFGFPGGDPLADPDLVGLLVGSEGCFAIVTGIDLALVPVPPDLRTVLAVFETVENAGTAVTRIMASGLMPAAVEIVDSETIKAVEASVYAAGYPVDAGAALVVEFDGRTEGLEADVLDAERCCGQAGALSVRTARDAEERDALWKGRKKAFGAMGRIAPDLLVQDATVPRTALPRVLAEIAEIGERHALKIANVFHAGDGNLHPNILFDRSDEAELARVEKASKEIMALCVESGGTITGEHGVGSDKREYMELVHGPEELRAMARVKAVFDPENLFNPGKVVPEGYAGPPERVPVPDTRGVEDAGAPTSAGVGASSKEDPEPVPNDTDPSGAHKNAVGGSGNDARQEAEIYGSEKETKTYGVEVWEPQREEEFHTLLREAGRRGLQVLPVGTGTHLVGELPDRPFVQLSLRRFSEIVHYEPADLTVTVGTGMPVGELQAELARHDQWLPFDPPDFGARTVGGLVAIGEGGPLAAHYGPLRNHVLGARVVVGDGRALELGGRVVKNVAGFDILRPLVGGLGGVALISATLRVFPIPESDVEIVFQAPDLGAAASAAQVFAKAPEPIVSVTMDGGGRVTARLHGRSETVRAARNELQEAAAWFGVRLVRLSLVARPGRSELPFGTSVRANGGRVAVSAGGSADGARSSAMRSFPRSVAFTYFALPASLEGTLDLVRADHPSAISVDRNGRFSGEAEHIPEDPAAAEAHLRAAEADRHSPNSHRPRISHRPRVTADAKVGRVRVTYPPGTRPPSFAVERMRRRCRAQGTALRVEGVPGVPVFDEAASARPGEPSELHETAARMATELRALFDPSGIFWNPRER